MKLTIKNIDCYYESAKVLEDVTFSVVEEDFVGIIGPNGSGKTTLLGSISGVLKPHMGVIWLDDSDIYMMKKVDLGKWTSGIITSLQRTRCLIWKRSS